METSPGLHCYINGQLKSWSHFSFLSLPHLLILLKIGPSLLISKPTLKTKTYLSFVWSVFNFPTPAIWSQSCVVSAQKSKLEREPEGSMCPKMASDVSAFYCGSACSQCSTGGQTKTGGPGPGAKHLLLPQRRLWGCGHPVIIMAFWTQQSQMKLRGQPGPSKVACLSAICNLMVHLFYPCSYRLKCLKWLLARNEAFRYQSPQLSQRVGQMLGGVLLAECGPIQHAALRPWIDNPAMVKWQHHTTRMWQTKTCETANVPLKPKSC